MRAQRALRDMTRLEHLLLEVPPALAWNQESRGPVEIGCELKHSKLAWCRLQPCNEEDPLRAFYRARVPAARNHDVCNKPPHGQHKGYSGVLENQIRLIIQRQKLMNNGTGT